MQYSHAAIPPYPQVIAADVLTIATDFQTIRLSASYSPVSGNVFVSSPGRDSSDLVFPPSWPGRLAVLPLVLRSSFDVPLTVERITSSDRRIIPILATEADGGAYADDSTLSAYVLYDPFPFCSSKRQRPRKRNFASPSAAHAEGMFAYSMLDTVTGPLSWRTLVKRSLNCQRDATYLTNQLGHMKNTSVRRVRGLTGQLHFNHSYFHDDDFAWLAIRDQPFFSPNAPEDL